MPEKTASRGGPMSYAADSVRAYKRRFAAVIPLAASFLSIVVSILLVSFFGGDGSAGNMIWIANGLLLAYLLLAPRWRWRAYLSTGLAAMIVGSALIREPWHINLFYNALDMIEVLVGAAMLRPTSTRIPQFTNPKFLIRFFTYAVLGGPLLAGSINAVVQAIYWHNAPLPLFFGWVTSDSLGIAVSCPIFVAILQSRNQPALNWRQNWFFLALLVGLTIAVFGQAAAPVMFLIYPALILVLLRLGLGWAALASLFVALAGGWFTLQGKGPLAASGSLGLEGRCLVLQVFVAAGVFMLYSVSVVLESRRAFERKLEKIVSLHNLITENSRDAIILGDLAGNRTYVSAAVERLIGWPMEEFAKVKSLALLHPADVEKARETVRSLGFGAEGVMLESRVRTYRGDYIWTEANLRLVRDGKTGAPAGVLNIMRDITERKLAEESRAFHHSLIRAINEVSLDGILVVNSNDKVLSYNRRFTEVWQIAASGGLASLYDDSMPLPDGRVLAKVAEQVQDPDAFVKRVRELYADPDAIDQCEILLKDGRTLERYSSSLQSAAGQYLGRVWFFRDISERKLAETKLQEAYMAVETLAATDALTGLANRRHFDVTLAAEWRRSLRERTPLSLLMIDADWFKLYNDTYGHMRGDSCLKQIAEAAQDVVCRPGDVVARFGGEEFAVILPNTDREGAMRLGMEIMSAMRERRLPHSASPRGLVTVSVGCATLVASLGQHAVNLVEAADDALYEAKNGGRDRLATTEPGTTPELHGVPGGLRQVRQTDKRSA